MRKIATAAAVFASLAMAAAPAFAVNGQRLNVPAEKWMSLSDLKQKLTDQGYEVYEIESDDGAYEVEVSKDGTRYDLHVHPETGEILPGYDD